MQDNLTERHNAYVVSLVPEDCRIPNEGVISGKPLCKLAPSLHPEGQGKL